MKQILVVLFFCMWSTSIFAQFQNIDEAEFHFFNKYSMGLDIGYALLTYHHGIHNALKNEGFTDIDKSTSFGLSRLNIHLDFSHSLQPNRDIGMLVNLRNRGEVHGLLKYIDPDFPNLDYISLYSSFRHNSVIPYYRFTNLSRRLQLDLGMSVNRISIRVDAYRSPYIEASSREFYPGIMIGGGYAILESPYFYCRIKGRFDMLFLPVETDPIEIELYDSTTNDLKNVQILKEKNLWMQKLIFSVSVGFKL